MKKIITLTLALLSLALVTACSSNDATSDTATAAPTTQAAPAPGEAPASDAASMPVPETAWAEAHTDGSSAHDHPISAGGADRETHRHIAENPWESPQTIAFTLHTHTASYRNIARMINNGLRPHPDAVRIAEMLNYFSYDTAAPPIDGSPFSIYTEIGPSLFNDGKYLAFVHVRAQDICRGDLPASNLTFLIDTSGSMAAANRLPLLQQSFGLLVPALTENDVVSIVTYAGCAQVLLDSVPGHHHQYIMDAINSLEARGHTAGGPGISMAYQLAMEKFDPAMNNRIILASDGDFNVGVSTTTELYQMMAAYRQRGIDMTILGVGMGNFRDDMLETIAQNGNANYHYIDTIEAAHKVFVEELLANMFVVAEDVRAQVTFNPYFVESARLIGYENRRIDSADFANDLINAGEIGVGAEVVLMFELALHENPTAADAEAPIFEVHIRYHQPGRVESRLISAAATHGHMPAENTADFTFAAAVAAFGHILRGSVHAQNITYQMVLDMAERSLGYDRGGHRQGFIALVTRFGQISP
jgi:Ca-activated chloride channel family protein